MPVGSFKQKASRPLVILVIGSSIIITALLWFMQVATARGEGYYDSNQAYAGYLN